MIGDHQQLPPSVESHDLVVNFGFDVSMMERLIKNDLPFVTLAQQGRMRPELAMMLTDIYPSLTTNTKVVNDSSRPAPRCVAKSLFFWDHNDPEEGDRGFCNPGEAERVAKLALFFVSQGYRPSKVTVIAACVVPSYLSCMYVCMCVFVHKSVCVCDRTPRCNVYACVRFGQPSNVCVVDVDYVLCSLSMVLYLHLYRRSGKH